MRTASGLGTLVPLLKVGSGVPVLGGGHVCVYRSVSHATCDYCPCSCSVLDWEGTLLRRRQGSWSSGAYKLTTEYQENTPRQREVPSGAHDRHIIWRHTSEADCDIKSKFWLFFFFKPDKFWLCMYTFTVWILLERRESNHTWKMSGTAPCAY